MRLRSFMTVFATVLLGHVVFAIEGPPGIVTKAEQVFGAPLNAEHAVFRLNESYVLWLMVDVKGSLIEVTVGPKSYYSSEFPNTRKPSAPEYLPSNEYRKRCSRSEN